MSEPQYDYSDMIAKQERDGEMELLNQEISRLRKVAETMRKNKSDYQKYAVDPAQRLVDEIERLDKLKLASLIAIAKAAKANFDSKNHGDCGEPVCQAIAAHEAKYGEIK